MTSANGNNINEDDIFDVKKAAVNTAPIVSSNSNDVEPENCSRNTHQPTTYRTYAIIVILFATNMVNFIDRFSIASKNWFAWNSVNNSINNIRLVRIIFLGVLTQMQKYFDIDDGAAGLMLTAYTLLLSCAAPIAGYLGDRYSRKVILVTSMVVWICAIVASTFVGRKVNNWYMTELYVLVNSKNVFQSRMWLTLTPSIIPRLLDHCPTFFVFSKSLENKERSLSLFGSGLKNRTFESISSPYISFQDENFTFKSTICSNFIYLWCYVPLSASPPASILP